MLTLRNSVMIFLLSTLFYGCTPGLFTKKMSTAPQYGPLSIGLSRMEVESYLGDPLLSVQSGLGQYTNIYEYHRDWTFKETLYMDIMNALTFGLGDYIISPMERHEGPKHLISITYFMDGQERKYDRVLHITNGFNGHPFRIVLVGGSDTFSEEDKEGKRIQRLPETNSSGAQEVPSRVKGPPFEKSSSEKGAMLK